MSYEQICHLLFCPTDHYNVESLFEAIVRRPGNKEQQRSQEFSMEEEP